MNEPDALEQQQSPTRDRPAAAEPAVPPDAPVADALEQAQEVAPVEHAARRDLPLEADDADAAEQAVVVAHDEDDYR